MVKLQDLLACAALVCSFGWAGDNTSDRFYDVIRGGDLTGLKALLDGGAAVDAADARGVTPLMNAAAVGSVKAMKVLIDRRANVNLQNEFGSTALMWAASDAQKVKLLLDHGAEVNKVTMTGRTALMIAALSNPSAEAVRMLLAKGADPKAKDQLGNNAFTSAIMSNDMATIRLLEQYSGDANVADPIVGFTPFMAALSHKNVASSKILLAKGWDVNFASPHDLPGLKVKNGTIAAGNITPLMSAVTYGPVELVQTLLDAGANINDQDIRGMTPLMLSITSDRADPAVLKLLLERGADPTLKSSIGETAFDWARKFGRKDALEALGGKALSAPSPVRLKEPAPDVRSAVQKSVALLETASNEFFTRSGCAACHAQSPAHFAIAASRAKGIEADGKLASEREKQMMGLGIPPSPILMERTLPFGVDGFLYPFEALARAGFAPNRITDFLVLEVALEQQPNGAWHGGGIARTPLQDGDFSRTAMGLRALKAFAPAARAADTKERIERAQRWLLEAKPYVTEDLAWRLAGVAAAGASRGELEKLAEPILASQRSDGGWAQREELASDAYATGMVLSILAETGIVKTDSPAYKSGVKFLLGTQASDGSWHVVSRAAKFQPYFESGFPYGHDQWISNIGTSWATNALAKVVEPASASERR